MHSLRPAPVACTVSPPPRLPAPRPSSFTSCTRPNRGVTNTCRFAAQTTSSGCGTSLTRLQPLPSPTTPRSRKIVILATPASMGSNERTLLIYLLRLKAYHCSVWSYIRFTGLRTVHRTEAQCVNKRTVLACTVYGLCGRRSGNLIVHTIP